MLTFERRNGSERATRPNPGHQRQPHAGLVALLTLVLLVAALLAYLAWGQRETAASNLRAPLAASTGMRQYYLTEDPVSDATQALTACHSGYHMASLGEIVDPSNLKYNTTLGDTRDDSSQGPPAFLGGLVRTGYNSDNSTTAGQGNCYN